MKAQVVKTEFLKAVQAAERAVNTKSSLPILSSLLLTVAGGRISIRATDLEVAITASAAVDPEAQDGSVAVYAHPFLDYIKAMSGAVIDLEADNKQLTVASGKSRFKMPVVGSPEEFPVLPPVEEEISFGIRENDLKELLERVGAAVGSDDTRPVLCSMLWTFQEGRLVAVATDTHRLHRGAAEVTENDGDLSVLVSGRACRELVRLLQGFQECHVIADKNQIQVRTQSATLVARLTDGQFPNFQKVIPTYSLKLTVNRDDLVEVANRAGIVAKDAAGKVVLNFGDGPTLIVTATSGDQGEAEEGIELGGTLEDQDKKVGANSRFLAEAVAAIPDEAVQFLHMGAGKPILIHGSDPDRFLAVVMPMSL